MPENFRRPPPGHAEHQGAHHEHEHEHEVWTFWGKHPELPEALINSAEAQAVSWHRPLNDPVWTDAYDHLRDDDPVLGLYLNRQARALPWSERRNRSDVAAT